MSFHVNVVGRWMHHDCDCHSILRYFTVTYRSRVESFHKSSLHTSSLHHFRYNAPPPPRVPLPASRIKRPTFIRNATSVATASIDDIREQHVTDETPDEVSHNEDEALDASTELTPNRHSPLESINSRTDEEDENNSHPGWAPFNYWTVPLYDLKFRGIALDELPICPLLPDRSSSYPALPHTFSLSIAAVFESYSERKSLGQLQQEFAHEMNAADTVWKTQHADSLSNWVSHELDSTLRVEGIVNLLVGSLLTSPRRMLHVLNTLKPVKGDFLVRAHCLYLTGFLYKSDLQEDDGLMEMFDYEVNKLRQPTTWPSKGINLDHLRLLMWRANEEEIKAIMVDIRQRYPVIKERTLLYLSMFCVMKEMPDEGFTFLRLLPVEALQTPSLLVRKCCMKLLTYETVVQTDAGPNFRYLPELLEKGLTPWDKIYDRVIERAIASDYEGVAWDVYRHAKSIDIPFSWRTYLLLLRQAFESKNVKGIDEIMSQIHGQEELYTHPRLLTYAMNMVRRINFADKTMTSAQGLSHILALYDRVYSRAPLVKLGITSEHDRHLMGADLEEPKDYVLSFTVWAYLLCFKHGRSAHPFWLRLTNLVDEGDETAIRCLQSDLVYNALIWLNLLHKDTYSNALEVFQYMLDKQFCLPTERTWSILICGFIHHDQRDQAKQIYDLMCQHNFTILHVREEYLPHGASLEDLERRLNDVLDEQSMLEGTSVNWAESLLSLSQEQDFEEDKTARQTSFGTDVAPSEIIYDLDDSSFRSGPLSHMDTTQ